MCGGRGKWEDALASRCPLGSQVPSSRRSLPRLECLSTRISSGGDRGCRDLGLNQDSNLGQSSARPGEELLGKTEALALGAQSAETLVQK